MAYFLKKNIKNGKTYLSIVNSFYDNKKGGTAHETYKSYGCIDSLIESGIEDPVAYLEKEVKKLNEDNNLSKAIKINDVAPYKFAGHFLVNSLLNKLNVKPIFDVYDLTVDYRFKLYDVLCSLIFSRVIRPCSKYKTFNDVLPYLDKTYSFSYDQLLEGLEYFGDNYEKIVEVFTSLVKDKYKINTDKTYFDCTNFYFEIDKEDDLRRKGPSKENRKEPIVGLGLLLDYNQVPINMSIYPGNQSEKPEIRKVIKDMKKQCEVIGKTIQVADKGLNCALNIEEAKKNGDGYLFSKSVKQLPQTEEDWILLDNGYKDTRDKDGNLLYKYKSCVDKFPYEYIDEKGNKHKLKFTEKRLVTYSPCLASKQKYEINKMVDKAKNLCLSKAKKDEYGESSKYVIFKGKDDSKVETTINEKKIEKDLKLAGYNLLVTSEVDMNDKDMYDTYHNLWRIEESFRIMKSELDARPVFVRKENTIKGHFLICYLSVLLIRLLQIYELKDEDSYQEIFKFIRDFKLTKYGTKYINMATKTDFMDKLEEKTKLPIENAMLSENQYNKIMSYKF